MTTSSKVSRCLSLGSVGAIPTLHLPASFDAERSQVLTCCCCCVPNNKVEDVVHQSGTHRHLLRAPVATLTVVVGRALGYNIIAAL